MKGVHSNGSEIRKQIKGDKFFLKLFPRFPWLMFFQHLGVTVMSAHQTVLLLTVRKSEFQDTVMEWTPSKKSRQLCNCKPVTCSNLSYLKYITWNVSSLRNYYPSFNSCHWQSFLCLFMSTRKNSESLAHDFYMGKKCVAVQCTFFFPIKEKTLGNMNMRVLPTKMQWIIPYSSLFSVWTL